MAEQLQHQIEKTAKHGTESKSPKTDESRGLFYSDAGYHMESVYNLRASIDCLTVTSFPSLSSPPPSLDKD